MVTYKSRDISTWVDLYIYTDYRSLLQEKHEMRKG